MAQNGWMESISRRMRMCAIIHRSHLPPSLPPPSSPLTPLSLRRPLAPAAVHSIMHHTPLSDYSVSSPARMTTRGESLPCQRPPHSTRTATPSPPLSGLHDTAGAYYCRGFDLGGRPQRWGRRGCRRSYVSFKEERGYSVIL